MPASNRGPRFHTTDGVGCESCHGPAAGWLASHYEVAGSHAANVANGMVALDQPQTRARVCLDCHYGSADEGQFVTHAMMAAGHPRISFELDLFSSFQQHHDVDADYMQRKGVADGEWLGYSKTGGLVVSAAYKAGAKEREKWTGEMPQAEFEKSVTTPLQVTLYPPLPPMWQARHLLGTDSKGWDVLAHILGGWQVNLKAVLLYLLFTYGVGVIVGSLMGFLGGWFDLTMQRVIEIIEEQRSRPEEPVQRGAKQQHRPPSEPVD